MTVARNGVVLKLVKLGGFSRYSGRVSNQCTRSKSYPSVHISIVEIALKNGPSL